MVVSTGDCGISRGIRGNLTCAGVAEDTLSTSPWGRVPVARQAGLHIRGSRHSLQSVPMP